MNNEAHTDNGSSTTEGTMNVETTEYEFSHGSKPRGRGTWAFYFDGTASLERSDWLDKVWWAPANLLYSAAKKLALAEAKRRNADSVAVCS